MKSNLLKKTLISSYIFLILLLSASIYADPRILSVSLVPPNPTFGQTATLTVNYCGDSYNSIWLAAAVSTQNTYQNAQLSGTGQWFVVGPSYPANVQKYGPGSNIGLQIRASLGSPGTCTDCGGAANGTLGTYTTTITIPNASDFPGCNISQLYLLIRMGQSNLMEGSWGTPQACAPNSSGYISAGWAIPSPPCDFTLHKRAEGVLSTADPNTGDLLLYSIDFTYSNGALTITDAIPVPGTGSFKLVSVGPASMWNPSGVPAIGSTGGGTITWKLPDRTGQPGTSSGTVWFLLRMATAITPGTKLSNSATGSMTGGNCGGVPPTTVKTDIVVGQAVATLTKSARSTNVNFGDTITYYLDYDIKGSRLVNYEPFDDIPTGTYNATPPSGWQYIPSNGDNGTWQIFDPCGTGDYIIKGSAGDSDYPGMTVTGPSFCTGMIVTDVQINATYEGADALVIIRNNNLASPNNKAYALVVSVDNTPANESIQICSPSCSWPAAGQYTFPGGLLSNNWYRVKINVLSDCHFQTKVWKKGDPEPVAYQVDYNEGTCSMPCTDPAGPSGWTSGVAEQGGVQSGGKYTYDMYNNFIVYQPIKSLDTKVYDTVPPGVTYAGYIGTAPALGAPVVTWNLGTLQDAGGSLTWLAKVTSCDPILNTGTVTGTGIVPVDSNVLEVDPICVEVSGLTKTTTALTPVMLGDTVTWIIKYCNDGQGTMHNYIVTDPVPAGMNCLGCLGGCTGCPGTGTITWNLGDVPKGVCNQSLTWWGKITAVP